MNFFFICCCCCYCCSWLISHAAATAAATAAAILLLPTWSHTILPSSIHFNKLHRLTVLLCIPHISKIEHGYFKFGWIPYSYRNLITSPLPCSTAGRAIAVLFQECKIKLAIAGIKGYIGACPGAIMKWIISIRPTLVALLPAYRSWPGQQVDSFSLGMQA